MAYRRGPLESGNRSLRPIDLPGHHFKEYPLRSFVDTNIFIYATYPSLPQYSQCREFLRSCLNGSDLWYLSWGVIYEYLRVVTHPRVFSKMTMTLLEAIENVFQFSRSSNVEILQETSAHFRYLKDLCHESNPVYGGILHDAHVVALMREHDIQTIYTADTDFNRFKGIEAISPL